MQSLLVPARRACLVPGEASSAFPSAFPSAILQASSPANGAGRANQRLVGASRCMAGRHGRCTFD